MRIFEIEGNFEQHGRWSEPDPGFEGIFFVNDDGYLYGYMDEQYPTPYNARRFIAGYYSENQEIGGICFYKLSNTDGLAPLTYTFPIWAEFGEWAALSLFSGMMSRQGKAKCVVKEIECSPELVDKIQSEFDKVDTSVNFNGEILDQIACCKDLLENIER